MHDARAHKRGAAVARARKDVSEGEGVGGGVLDERREAQGALTRGADNGAQRQSEGQGSVHALCGISGALDRLSQAEVDGRERDGRGMHGEASTDRVRRGRGWRHRWGDIASRPKERRGQRGEGGVRNASSGSVSKRARPAVTVTGSNGSGMPQGSTCRCLPGLRSVMSCWVELSAAGNRGRYA